MTAGQIVTVNGTDYKVIFADDCSSTPNLRKFMDEHGFALYIGLEKASGRGHYAYQAFANANGNLTHLTRA